MLNKAVDTAWAAIDDLPRPCFVKIFTGYTYINGEKDATYKIEVAEYVPDKLSLTDVQSDDYQSTDKKIILYIRQGDVALTAADTVLIENKNYRPVSIQPIPIGDQVKIFQVRLRL